MLRRPGRAARIVALVVALLAPCAMAPPRVRAQSVDLPEELRSIGDVRFRGLQHLGKRQLKAAGLRTHKPSRLPWRDRPLIRRDYLRADSTAIVSLYRHYGYLDAALNVRLLPGRDPRSAVVLFDVHEGGLTRVGTVAIEGDHVFPPGDLQHALQAQPGRAYDPAFLQLDVLKLRTMYQERGYSARVDTSARRGIPDSASVQVRYGIVEGPQYRVGRIEYTHGPRVREFLGRRELLLKPGDVFKRSRLDLSVEHMYGTGLFRQVQVTTVPDSATAKIDLLLRVGERAPRWVDVGVGSGTTNRYQVTSQLGHRNIDTRALGVVLDGKVARDGQNHPLTQSATLTLSEPWFLGVRLLGQSAALYSSTWDRHDPNFTRHLDQRGFNFSLYKEVSRIARVTVVQENIFARESYAVNSDTTSAAEDAVAQTVVPRYRTNTLRLILERDLRDDKILPHRGSYQTLTSEVAGGPLKGSSSYSKGVFSSTWYSPLKSGWLFAARATAGVMRPMGGTGENFSPDIAADPEVRKVPQESRFFIGGVNSLRGYPENSIPASGGLAMALVNLEWRIPVAGPFGVEVFLDSGNVWARPEYIKGKDLVAPWNAHRDNLGDIRYTYGIGGRLVLPFGPLRIDFARGDHPDFPGGVKFFGGRRVPFVYQFAIGPSF